MAALLDKIKGMFGGAKADEVKDQVDDVVDDVDRVGEVPDQVEDVLPGDADDDGR